MTQSLTGAYQDRMNAGRILASYLISYRDDPKKLVLGIPRGGVPVASEISIALDAPLDVFLVRKLRAPNHPELAIGAVASSGICVLNQDIVRDLRISQAMIETVSQHETAELVRRERNYRGNREVHEIEGRTVILVDDGLTTGSSMRAAISALRVRRPKRIVAAVPVGAPGTCQALLAYADDVVCPLRPDAFVAVSRWYRDFSPIMDRHIHDLLEYAPSELATAR